MHLAMQQRCDTPEGVEFYVQAFFDDAEADRLRQSLDYFEGIPIDPIVDVDGVRVRIDTPKTIFGQIVAHEDLVARFVCPPHSYERVVDGIDRYLRRQLAELWP
jgi:hypothetical protein